ncbi:MAG: hypothetical protein FJ030_17750 [Chloroflexi bacterium]|nr:hypothetical protein [Chloroflexota bacterium]
MRLLANRIIVLTLLLALSGCDVVRGLAPLFLPNAPTPQPTNTPYPTPTPQPSITVNFKVTVPVNTPSGSSVILFMPDLVGGAAHKTLILNNAGNNVWVGSAAVPIGSLLRYRYQRVSGSQIVGESRPDGNAIVYRTALASGAVTVEDTVAAWSDTPFVGDKGRITGIVRNASSNQGLPGIIISGGGQQIITGFDGEYVLWNVTANAATAVTAFAPDGSFRTAMNTTTPPANGTVGLDFGLSESKTVKVTFLVAPPTETPAGAPLRLVGNTLQLGDTFVMGAMGSTTSAQREPTLLPLSDGRWAASLFLYEGMDLRYKYTLGSATINSELNGDGSPAIRQIILPGSDEVIIQDQIATWKSSIDSPASFSLSVPPSTPAADEVTVQFKINNAWLDPLPMWRANVNSWNYTLLNPLDFAGQAEYRFCRNYQCGLADDGATFGPNPAGYRFTPTVLPQALQNNVGAWQWWADVPAPALTLPPVNAHPGFQSGIELAAWRTAETPILPAAFDAIKPLSANWIRIPIVWDAPSANPPLISFDFARSPFRSDLIATIKAAREREFKVALLPQVKPAPGGPFAGDLNLYFDAGAKDPGWWDGWFREYARFIAYVADVAAFTGAEMYYLGDATLYRALPGSPNAPADSETRWRNLIAALRKDHYNAPMAFGLDLFGQSPTLTAPPPFLDAVDVIDIRFSAALTASPTASLEELKTGAANLIDSQLQPLYSRFSKTIVITAQYVSTDGSAAQCIGLAVGGCQPLVRVAPDQPDTPVYPLDLSEQQLAYEALLYAVNDRAWINGFYAYGYNPIIALRDKYYSPRGKPAEALLAAWFARIK